VYLALKFLHVFLAIIAVGFTSSFGLILARAARGGADGRELKFALGTIRVMGMVGHVCFLLLLITGIGFVQIAGYPWYLWLKLSGALVVVALLVAQFLLLPTVPRRLAILETKGPSRPRVHRPVEAQRGDRRGARADGARGPLADGVEAGIAGSACCFSRSSSSTSSARSWRSGSTPPTG